MRFFNQGTPFAGGHGQTQRDSRDWEEGYRNRWRYDKVVRSTHGVNCTGSCSWKIFVKNGVVTWETQATDYPETRPELPNHEPRGCPRGASYSWYLYSSHRVKYPMVRARLLKLWREAKALYHDPVLAWKSIAEDETKSKSYKEIRGLGGMVRANWDEMLEIIAASNVHTIKAHGPDRVVGFSPIPAMSMVSFSAGSRYISLLGGVMLSFYDWYCDLPVASPQTWGEQTDVPESADWYNAGYTISWGSNVPQTRTPDAHFLTESKYKGTKVVAITPDYAEITNVADEWVPIKQGTDAALAQAMVQVVLKEFYENDQPSEYFQNYSRENTDLPFLVCLEEKQGQLTHGRFLRAADIESELGESADSEWKPVVWDEIRDGMVVPTGTIGHRWSTKGKWNIEQKDHLGNEIRCGLSAKNDKNIVMREIAFPVFTANGVDGTGTVLRQVPVRQIQGKNGVIEVASVYDLMVAHYQSFSPEWQEKITGIPAATVTRLAREFAQNAHETHGRSLVLIGASVNHWFHSDMGYRAIIALLMLCGTIGQSGGGWAHYVGQEKLRPQSGWAPIAFGLDWSRPPRHQNGTSFWYTHTDQWRYERLNVPEILGPLADPKEFEGSIVDFNVRAERMGWLPGNPHWNRNPLEICKQAKAAGLSPEAYAVQELKSGKLKFASEDPDAPENFPRNLFLWRNNLLGSSSKGHEYFLKHLLGTKTQGVMNPDNREAGLPLPSEVQWRDQAPIGKLDLLVTLDFRMSTSCLHSDIVLPTATWYEKNDLNTSDMHPFIHPLTAAVDPVWESRSDWEIFKAIAAKFSEICPGHLGVEQDLVSLPLQHDTAMELSQATRVQDWKKGECDLIPGKTAPKLLTVERDYPNTYHRMVTVGPLLEKLGNGGKGMNWETAHEVEHLGHFNGTHLQGPMQGRPKLVKDTDVAEAILQLAPETNGQVAVKAWRSLEEITGLKLDYADARKDEQIHFKDIVQQPRKIISSPIWSGLESHEVCYTANYTNLHGRIPWRTLTGRQQFYQDHAWMQAFGEQLAQYKPPVDMKSLRQQFPSNGEKEIVLNFLTAHQKWGIHSSYTDSLIMLTLFRGGPVVWLSEKDSASGNIKDNDWVEVFNGNGSLAARAVVSQRIPEGAVFVYHAQEKTINTPLSQSSNTRGLHNSISRIVLKPTHMIGGYAHQAYGFNYIGTIGTNRDEFVIVRKLSKVEWE